MRSIVRFVTLIGSSILLSACGAQGRVAFDAGATQPKKPVADAPQPAPSAKNLAAVEVKTIPPDVTVAAQAPVASFTVAPAETLATTPTADPALKLAVNEYRSSVTASLTFIWQHVVPTVDQCATFVGILDRLLASNVALRERDDLSDADRAMLDESNQVLNAERFKLIAKWTAGSRSVLPN